MAHSTRVFSIPATHELRFELEGATDALSVKLVGGYAEVFGYELVLGQTYSFSHEQRGAVWAPGVNGDGAEVEMSDLSQPDDEVTPPRVLVVGERGAGKSTLIKMLLNWRNRAARATAPAPASSAVGGATGAAPGMTIVNLDPSDGLWTMPGTLGVVSTSSLLPTTTPAASFGTSFSSGPPMPFAAPTAQAEAYTPPINPDAYAALLDPLVFFAGHTSSSVNEPHYELLLKSVAEAARRKTDESGTESWKAGCFVDTPGEWAEKKGGGWEKVKAAVREFEINVLLVVGSERSYVEMSKLMNTNKTVTVVRVPKSDGASDLDLPATSRLQALQTRSYFYGGPPLTQGLLSPFSIIVHFSSLRIVRVGEQAGSHAPSSALPLGATRLTRDTELVEVDLELPTAPREIVNRVLAVPMAEEEDGEERVVKGPVMGFVWVSAVDQAKKKVTLLSPLPGRLPRKTLILGGIDWVDSPKDERIPERVVHARGAGAHGYFKLNESLADYTCAKVLTEVGVETPTFTHFSTVLGSNGAAETAREVRGFATKFYTKEGNWDIVGNNIPVFFMQEGMQFPDLVHAGKPEPQIVETGVLLPFPHPSR
ncbi:Cleavage polyadenylation factor subunit clp1 [Rhodosporidiobolus nylandii]